MGAAQAGNGPCPRGYAGFRKRLRTVRANPPESVTELSFSSPPSAYSVGFQAPVNAKQTERASLPSGIPAGHSGRGQGADILPPHSSQQAGLGRLQAKGWGPLLRALPTACICLHLEHAQRGHGQAEVEIDAGGGVPKDQVCVQQKCPEVYKPLSCPELLSTSLLTRNTTAINGQVVAILEGRDAPLRLETGSSVD